MTKDHGDKLVTNAVKVRAFILESLIYDHVAGAIYMKGTQVRLPVEPANGYGKRPRIRIMGQPVLAAHVAHILKTGNWPHYPLRHLNGDETDIRWSNIQLVRTENDEETTELLAQMANDAFLADLRRYHPKGPPTYQIKSGKPIVFHKYAYATNGYGGGPSAMLADF